MATIGRVIIVTRPTQYEGMVLSAGSSVAARFILKGSSRDLSWYKAQHDRHNRSVDIVVNSLPKEVQTVFVSSDLLKTFAFRNSDVIIALGPDGLLANISKYILGGQTVITVDSDSETNGGKLMKHKPESVASVIKAIYDGSVSIAKLPLVSAKFASRDAEVLALNEVLVGRLDQVSARYAITAGGKTENQISSGVLISTGVGASGWLSSIANMLKVCTGRKGELENLPEQTDRELVYFVREAFPSRDSQATIITGRIRGNAKMTFESYMPSGGVIVSDGDLANFSSFDAGEKVIVGLSNININLAI